MGTTSSIWFTPKTRVNEKKVLLNENFGTGMEGRVVEVLQRDQVLPKLHTMPEASSMLVACWLVSVLVNNLTWKIHSDVHSDTFIGKIINSVSEFPCNS